MISVGNLISLDIETAESPDAFLFEPEYKEPRRKKDGEPYASDKSVEQQRHEFMESCALKAHTGRVLCFTYCGQDLKPNIMWDDNSEPAIISAFWSLVNQRPLDQYIVGWNISWDLMFMRQRSIVHGIKMPRMSLNERGLDSLRVIDLQREWNCYVHGQFTSLADFAKATKIGLKDEYVQKHFGEVWMSDRQRAVDYAKNDAYLEYKAGELLL